MAQIHEIKTERDARADNAIAMLEGVIDRIRVEGVSQVSIFYSPLSGDDAYSDFFCEEIYALVGALEVQKFNALRYREGDE